jgi:hypothetical protein
VHVNKSTLDWPHIVPKQINMNSSRRSRGFTISLAQTLVSTDAVDWREVNRMAKKKDRDKDKGAKKDTKRDK